MPTRSFIFAGGGTGGHLYPGLAIAAELQQLAAKSRDVARCVFLCSNRAIDAEILRTAGAEFIASPARPFSLRPLALARFIGTWGRSVREARQVIRAEKTAAARTIVVAMGGFVAAPAAQAARVERVPLALVNLDAVPGRANRWLARRASSLPLGLGAFTAASVDAPFARMWTTVPPIVRRDLLTPREPRACRERLGLDPDRPVLMVTGGSQGARSVNDFVARFAESDTGRAALGAAGHGPRWQVLHQTGKGGEAAAAAYQRAGVDAVVQTFSESMGDWWGAAELAIARSGAGNVAEAWATRTPTLFLPYPFHKDEHQKFNALPLVDCGGAVLARDYILHERNLAEHAGTLAALLTDAARRDRMRRALAGLGPANGAERVARALWEAGQAAS